MPLVIPVELPTPDVVIVVPDDVPARVIVFVDPRVPFRIAAETIEDVQRFLKESVDLCAVLAADPVCTAAYTLALG